MTRRRGVGDEDRVAEQLDRGHVGRLVARAHRESADVGSRRRRTGRRGRASRRGRGRRARRSGTTPAPAPSTPGRAAARLEHPDLAVAERVDRVARRRRPPPTANVGTPPPCRADHHAVRAYWRQGRSGAGGSDRGGPVVPRAAAGGAAPGRSTAAATTPNAPTTLASGSSRFDRRSRRSPSRRQAGLTSFESMTSPRSGDVTGRRPAGPPGGRPSGSCRGGRACRSTARAGPTPPRPTGSARWPAPCTRWCSPR